MTLHIHPELEQRSEDWYAQRRGMVTASAVAGLLSVRPLGAMGYACPTCDAEVDMPCWSQTKKMPSPIKTIHPARVAVAEENADTSPPVIGVADNDTSRSITALLTAERITDYTEPTFMSNDMFRGVLEEPLARDMYSEHVAPVTEVGFMVRDDWGFKIGYSPDGLVGDDGLIEVKSRRQKKQLTTVLSDAVPPENMAQLQTGLLVSGRKWIDYISYSSGMHLWVKRVLPDPAWHAAIVAAVANFEANAERMAFTYLNAVAGMPVAERIDHDMEMSL